MMGRGADPNNIYEQNIINETDIFKLQEEYIHAFVQEMNKQAKKLKLDKQCQFTNPHGLQEKSNHASAQDICKIASYAMKYDIFKEIAGKKEYECRVIKRNGEIISYQWYNSNKLLN